MVLARQGHETAMHSGIGKKIKDGSHRIVQCPNCQTKFAVPGQSLQDVESPRFHCSRCDELFALDLTPLPERSSDAGSRSKDDARTTAARSLEIPIDYENTSTVRPPHESAEQSLGTRSEELSPAHLPMIQEDQSSEFEDAKSEVIENDPDAALEDLPEQGTLATSNDLECNEDPISDEPDIEDSVDQVEDDDESMRSVEEYIAEVLGDSDEPAQMSFSFLSPNQNPKAPRGPTPETDVSYDESDNEVEEQVFKSSEHQHPRFSIQDIEETDEPDNYDLEPHDTLTDSEPLEPFMPDDIELDLPVTPVLPPVASEAEPHLTKRHGPWQSLLGLALPIVLFFSALLVFSFFLRSGSDSALAFAKTFAPVAVQAPPPGLHIRDIKFRAVTLDNGDQIQVVSGVVANDSRERFREILIEAVAFSDGGTPLKSIQVNAASTLAKTRIKSLTPEMIANLQSGKMARRFELRQGQEQEFAIALLGNEMDDAKYYSARIYSVKY